MHSEHCTIHIAQYTVHSEQCNFTSVQCKVYSAQYAVHCIHIKLSNAHSKHQLPAVKTLLSNAIPALAIKYHPTIGSMEVNRYQGYLTQFKLILISGVLKYYIFIPHEIVRPFCLKCKKIKFLQTTYIIFAGPKRGRPTPGFSIFIRSDVRRE